MTVRDGIKQRKKYYIKVVMLLTAICLLLAVVGMCVGNTFYQPATVVKVLLGQNVKGASFTIFRLRLPRVLAAIGCGYAFGLAGNVFQKLLKNPLASPDIIGVTSGSSVAAVFGILIMKWNKVSVAIFAVLCGLAVAALIYYLASSGEGGFSNNKLILIGIGAHAFLGSMISWMLLKAASYDVQSALRWLSGSLNNVELEDVILLYLVLLIFTLGIIKLKRELEVAELGDGHAKTLGVDINKTRILLILFSLIMLAVATSVSGAIASVSFLAGPIANRIAGQGKANILSSALTGSVMVLGADLVAMNLLPARYPVGIVTGIIGAPYLIYLLMVNSKKGVA